MVKIIQKENSILREKAAPVAASDVGSAKITKVLRDMRTALESRDDGIAIAAPQIGVSLRIFLVSPRAFEIEEHRRRKASAKTEEELTESEINPNPRVFINPEILKASKTRNWLEEGCLSVHHIYGKAHRATKVSVRALDETGKPFTMTGNTLLSQIFQHEIDHLNGILFSDHARDLHSIDDPNEQE